MQMKMSFMVLEVCLFGFGNFLIFLEEFVRANVQCTKVPSEDWRLVSEVF